MRTRLFFLLFLFPAVVFAQIQQQVQQRPNMIERPVGCYQSLKQRGLQAQKAGNLNEAERLFREALQCREVQNNGRYRSELNILIARGEVLRQAPVNNSRGEVRGKGRFRPSAAFLKNSDPNCYEITLQEADRAFQNNFWEDAAALYRAAKICADADQAKRQAMNDRIEDCRKNAENELLKKERQAVWQARQAIATTRANDAAALLLRGDRTRAYRLADFANEYIAPENEDNPDCLQTMFDAWYFDPALYKHMGVQFKAPFCYQLADNLGRDAQVRFAGEDLPGRIYVFAPKQHLLQIWDASTLKPLRAVTVDTSFSKFDVFPDGRTMLFESPQGYTLWRPDAQPYRISLGEGRCYTIDPDGRSLHYFDPDSKSIQTLAVQTIFGSTKAYQTQRSNPSRSQIDHIKGDLLQFRFSATELWLLYQDSVVVWSIPAGNSDWARNRSRLLERPDSGKPSQEKNIAYHLDPATGTIIASGSLETLEWRIAENDSPSVTPVARFPGRLLGVADNNPNRAYWQYSVPANSYIISITENPDSAARFNMLALFSDDLSTQQGVFSADMKWFAVTNSSGTVKLWSLLNNSNTVTDGIPGAYETALSPNGLWAAARESNRIAIFETDNLKNTRYTVTLTNENIGNFYLGNQWMIYRQGLDSVGILNWQQNIHHRIYLPTESAEDVIALDEDKEILAFNAAADSIEIRSLRTGKLIAAKKLGGIIRHLAFFPGGSELLVIQNLATLSFWKEQPVPKIWNYEQPGEPLKTISLHGAEIYYTDIHQSGRKIAFSDGRYIRIYSKDDLQDEHILIRPFADKYITALRFHTNSDSIAVAYTDGAIRFWDTETGALQVQLSPAEGITFQAPQDAADTRSTLIKYLSLSGQGDLIRAVTEQGQYIARLLPTDMDAIRSQAQDEYRHLEAFTLEDIRDFELAYALEDADNFTRLATSGDLPLIRSFFEYYQSQALNGNNIDSIGKYCDRAFSLFAQLEETARQDLQNSMLEMYGDWGWKLLLRRRTGQVRAVAQTLNDYFDQPALAQLLQAHAALLDDDDDDTGAGKNYVSWLIRDMEENPWHDLSMDDLQANFLQMAEFDLLNERRRACVCSIFGSLIDLQNLCAEDTPDPSAFFDAETNRRWKIFNLLENAGKIPNSYDKIRILRATLQDAETLRKQYPAGWDAALTKKALDVLTQTYIELSRDFEQSSPRAITLLKELDALCAKVALPAKYAGDIARQKARNNFELGNLYFKRGILDSAEYYYNLTEELTQPANLAEGEIHEQFNNEITGPLWTKIGELRLALNQPELAEEAFNRANQSLSYGLNTLYLGHVALLQGRFDTAWVKYGGIFEEEQLGMACADLDALAAYLPSFRSRLLEWSSKLRDSISVVNPYFDPDAVQYFYARFKMDYTSYRNDWLGALQWSETTRRSAEMLLNKNVSSENWLNPWLDAHINTAYYLLFNSLRDSADLSRAIRYSESAERYILTDYPKYTHLPYLYTNLAHAYWLRNYPGDRDKALAHYQTFLNQNPITGWETLQKDFRDLHAAGIRWPDLQLLIQTILPNVQITDREWLEIGVSTSER